MELKDIDTLIAKISLGDRDAFSRLYDATSAKLFAICLRVVRERSAAEDTMQDVYLKIWKNAGHYQVTGHSPMTWLITIARNTAIDRVRARKHIDDIEDHSYCLLASGPTPEQSAVAAAEARRIIGCLDELEHDRRDAIKGAYLNGETYKDLSERFDVPLNTMRTLLRRGLIALRECMSR